MHDNTRLADAATVPGRSHRPAIAPKAIRDKIFKKSRPHIRPLREEDFGVLWVAYLRGSFTLPKMDEKQFVEWIYATSQRMVLYVVEDAHSGFKSGRGLTGLISITSNGWMVNPVMEFFAWATPRHRLRAAVGAIQAWRHQATLGGVLLVMVHEKDHPFMERLLTYGGQSTSPNYKRRRWLEFRGRVPWGYSDGHMVMYSMQSRKR